MVVPRTGKPIAVIPEIGAECMSRTWLDDIWTWPSPVSRTTASRAHRSRAKAVGDGNAFGVAMGAETHLCMPLLDFEQVTTLALEIADATPILRQLAWRSRGGDREDRHICGIVSDVFEAMPNWLAAGMPVSEVFRRFKIDALERGADDVLWSAVRDRMDTATLFRRRWIWSPARAIS